MEPNYFIIMYKWKDQFDDVEPTTGVVTDTHEVIEDRDDEIFYYGLTEELIREAIELKEKTVNEFIILDYEKYIW